MYLIQEKVAHYTFVDVYECDTEEMAIEFCNILKNKYAGHIYRIVRLYV